MTADAINNRDFYGTEIRHKDDPFIQQLGQFAAWTAKQATPFSFSGGAKLLKEHGAGPSLAEMLMAAKKHPGDVALGQLGFQPAPSFIQNTPALTLAREYSMENRPPGTKTAEQAKHYEALSAIYRMYRTGEVDQAQIDKYIDDGAVTDKDVTKAERESDESPIEHVVKNLTPEQVVNVYAKADPEERAAIEDYADRIRTAERKDAIQDGIDKINGNTSEPATAGGPTY
jgi:hypothetical protein